MNLVLPQLLLDCGHPWSQRVTRPQRVWLVSVLELSLSHLPSPRTTAAVTSQQRASADTAGPSLHPPAGTHRDIWYNIWSNVDANCWNTCLLTWRHCGICSQPPVFLRFLRPLPFRGAFQKTKLHIWGKGPNHVPSKSQINVSEFGNLVLGRRSKKVFVYADFLRMASLSRILQF